MMATENTQTQAEGQNEQWFLKARCPVLLPSSDALTLSTDDFDAFLAETLTPKPADNTTNVASHDDNEALDAEIDKQPPTTAGIRARLEVLMTASASDELPSQIDADHDHDIKDGEVKDNREATHLFMAGLHQSGTTPPNWADNKMYTENGDIAHVSTNEPLIDLFFELEEVVSGPRLRKLLDAAWEKDPLMALKVIFNARSIHLGKSSRTAFYRSAGWLAENHPRTLIANLRWLSRPVIPKKLDKDEDADDLVIVESEPVTDADYDVRNGVAHGYWKDLLNILVLSVNNKLDGLSNPREILNTERTNKREKWPTQEEAKEKREEVRTSRHDVAVEAFEHKPVYRALHLTVARLFAEQLKADLAALNGIDAKAKKTISLCGKWAPSTARFHDKHTLIVSSIAELLYPARTVITNLPADANREIYLRYARETYRKDTAALRKHLEVVERDLSAKTLSNIKYDCVPSAAMSNYAPIFAEKDTDRFEAYLDAVAGEKSRISGATLLPSTLIHAVSAAQHGRAGGGKKHKNATLKARIAAMDAKVVDGQWKTLVQRIKDSGTLEASMAVCDVSGSMGSPVFPDGTCPMDSAIGLSLLLAEVTAPPFGGTFITFSETPVVEKVDLSKTLKEKYEAMQSSAWGMSTNFEAVFLDLILPMAVKNKLAPEDMVRRLFVFSDMQFNEAQGYGGDRWSTSYQRVQEGFKKAGYEVPEMVFWNLAGGRGGYVSGYDEDAAAPKPATAEDEGVALVSGYSQGMLKVFMDKGMFEEEEEVVVAEKHGLDSEDEDMVEVEKQVKKPKQDPLAVVKKSISHKAYAMLKVVD